MAEAMGEEKLARLAGLAELPCTCGDADCGNYTSALTTVEARKLVDEVKRLRDRDAQLSPEYGLRVFYVNTLTEERAIANTLAGALDVLDRFDARDRRNVVSRELMQRPVGKWRKVGEEDGRG